RCYGREAAVVYPPVSLERFDPAPRRDDFYLVVSALVPYKRVDLAVDAFNRLGRRLVVIGDGPEGARLRRMAGSNVEFLGRRSDPEVADWLSRCRAFVFPAEDDFGITAVEAQASGAPVIAYAAGGATETVIDLEWTPDTTGPDSTGVLFHPQTPAALMAAVERFERRSFHPGALRENARRFGVETFRRSFRAEVDRLLDGPARAFDDGRPQRANTARIGAPTARPSGRAALTGRSDMATSTKEQI
ncbi:MAG TPA: glycosyltransferase, partial [Longimicrobiaceae bacterium]|nr:glycosyltransferase [Longimicrobiaceae bacterium]